MGRPKNSKNKAPLSKPQERKLAIRAAVQKEEAAVIAGGSVEIDLSAKILDRIYHPEDYPHDCPSPRDDMDGFLRWLSSHT